MPAADSVILYEPVPSAIRAIQRRGRTARQSDGSVHILVAKGTRDQYVQSASIRKEDSMYKALDSLQKQSRLPRRVPPATEVLSSFKVGGRAVEEFIKAEKLRLQRKHETNTIVEKNETSSDKITLRNRPKSQKSLADFSKEEPSNEIIHQKSLNPSKEREKENNSSEAAKEIIDKIVSNGKNEVCITVDHRESNSSLPSLLKLHGHDISLEHLIVGDIKISERVLIERKSARDLVDSIIDGRLIHQARKLQTAVARPLLVVESMENDRLHPNAIFGAMAWLTLDLGLPVIMTGSIEQTARFISVVAKRESRVTDLVMANPRKRSRDSEKSAIKAAAAEIMSIINGERESGFLSKKWEKEIVSQRIRILSELPGIGRLTAERIMQEAKDIVGLCSMSEQDMVEIDGVSHNQAKSLYRFLHG